MGALRTPPPTAPCDRIVHWASIDADVDVGGFRSERYTWRDAGCEPRSAALVHNNVRDPSGHYGGIAPS